MKNNIVLRKLILILACLGLSICSPQLIAKSKQSIEITQAMIKQHKQAYIESVVAKQSDINCWFHDWIMQGAADRGYDEFSCKCIPISYRFFDEDNDELMRYEIDAIGSNADVKYINEALAKFMECVKEKKVEKNKLRKKDKDELKNNLSEILHIKHVESLTLPGDANKQDLKKHPDKLVPLVDDRKIDKDEYYPTMARNMFVAYWVEKVEKYYE